MSWDMNEQRITLNEVAKRLRVHIATVWRWTVHGVRGRKLATVTVGGRRWVLERDLAEFLGAERQTRSNRDAERRRRNAVAESMLDAFGLKSGDLLARAPAEPETVSPHIPADEN